MHNFVDRDLATGKETSIRVAAHSAGDESRFEPTLPRHRKLPESSV
jgi:hypothetical protein